jgi:hypothetical protein
MREYNPMFRLRVFCDINSARDGARLRVSNKLPHHVRSLSAVLPLFETAFPASIKPLAICLQVYHCSGIGALPPFLHLLGN